jgi:hypothetical protein
VTINDVGGSSAATSATINVAAAGSKVSITGLTTPNATEGIATGTFTVATFSDTNSNVNINNLTATVSWGDGSSDTLTAANGGIVGSSSSYSVLDGHTYGEEGTGLAFSVSVSDSAGGSASTSATISVKDAALSVTALTAPASPTEGISTGSFTVATFSDANTSPDINDFTATVAWGDGTTDTLTKANSGIAASSGGFAVLDSHTYGEEGSGLTFSVSIADKGGSSAATSATVSVADAALSITGLTTPKATEGITTGSFTVATFTDANGNPDIKDYTATLKWGDGTTDILTNANGGIAASSGGGFAILDSHTYSEESANPLIYSLSITDKGGASAPPASATVTVADAALTVKSFNPPSNAVVGVSTGTFTVATFADANTSPTIGDFTATVAWGDGTTDTLTSGNGGIKASGGTFAILDSHTYNAPLTGATFSVTITDVGGSSTSTSATINVKQSTGLTINSLTPGSYTEGAEGSLMTVANFTDTNSGATTFTATVTFGDGTSVNKTLANGGIVKNQDGSYSVQVNHRYGEEGNYTFSVKVTDNKGASTSTAASLSVADAPLTIKTFTPPSPTQGMSFTATLVTFTDGNPKPDTSDYTATINWGDGSSSTETVANGGITGTTTFSIKGTHTYNTFGNFTLSVPVVDGTGSSTSTSATIVVHPHTAPVTVPPPINFPLPQPPHRLGSPVTAPAPAAAVGASGHQPGLAPKPSAPKPAALTDSGYNHERTHEPLTGPVGYLALGGTSSGTQAPVSRNLLDIAEVNPALAESGRLAQEQALLSFQQAMLAQEQATADSATRAPHDSADRGEESQD